MSVMQTSIGLRAALELFWRARKKNEEKEKVSVLKKNVIFAHPCE